MAQGRQGNVRAFRFISNGWLLLTTNEGDLVLDNCAGSGTTGVACKNLNRNYILIEKEPEYCHISEARINSVKDKLL